MKPFTICVTQTETRTYTLLAESEDSATEQAQAWSESPSGNTPDGCIDYSYSFESDTAALAIQP